ncbi:uncharacterized protein [Argopecten irradians]|uniref:uncharacterized protein n=1 Tax=Argopecten irradians TaxID=31199 RepID=UPI00371DD9C7
MSLLQFLLVILLPVLLVSTVAARSTSDLYEELVDVLKEIDELEKDKEMDKRTDGEKTGTIVTRDIETDIEDAFKFADDRLMEYNDLKQFYYTNGGHLEVFETKKQLTKLSYIYDYELLQTTECATSDVKAFVFEVRACNDAHVGLKEDQDQYGRLYEIVIGGWDNSRSVIRNKRQQFRAKDRNDEKGLLDCNEYRTFFVGWAGANIQVSKLDPKTSTWVQILQWQDSSKQPYNVQFIGLTTAKWADGHFRVPKREPDIIIKTPRTFDTTVFEMLHEHGLPAVRRPPYLMFEVMACRNAHIALFERDDQNVTDGIEIIFGNDLNMESIIRSGDTELGRNDMDGVVDCNEYRAFMISWYGGNMQVLRQRQKGWEVFMTGQLDPKRSFDYIGVTTNVHGDGKWRIVASSEVGLDPQPGDTHTSEAIAALNNMMTAESFVEKEEEAAIRSLMATKRLLQGSTFKDLAEIKQDSTVQKKWSGKFDSLCNTDDLDCDESAVYRTINGECNNVDHPHWGAAHIIQNRLLPPAYQDGIDSPRTLSVNGSPLPSARYLSVEVFTNKYDATFEPPDDTQRSLMVMVWGQFTDHDVGETPISRGYRSSTVECCGIVDTVFRNRRDQCFIIPIDQTTDPVFTNRDCMNFVRSVPAQSDHCLPGVREQLNAITSYVDGSMVYGSEDDVAWSLRSFYGGKMKTQSGNLLPENSDRSCVRDGSESNCFEAGDIRVNENPLLATIHTAFVRYHNILAERFDSSLSDEDIYQRTRQIIGALIQQITYSKWLPSVLGPNYMTNYSLDLSSPYVYNDSMDAGMLSEVTTAAYRYGHTLIKDVIQHADASGQITRTEKLEDLFFATQTVFDDAKGIARGIFLSAVSASDRFFVQAIDRHLFGPINPFDLSALNIQRGRDHGLPGYVDYLKHCSPNQDVPTDFKELPFHNDDVKNILSYAYQ